MSDTVKNDVMSEVARGQAVVEARVECAGGKLLSVNSAVTAAVSEVFVGEVRYSGRVRFDCLIDGENGVECVSGVADFSDHMTSSAVLAGMNPTITAKIINVDSTLDNGAIKLVAVVDTVATASCRRDFSVVKDIADGVYTENRELRYCSVLLEPHETLYVSDTVSGVNCSSVLFCSSHVVVSDVRCGNNEVAISGKAYTVVVVRGNDGLISSYRQITPIEKVLSAMGIREEHFSRCSCDVVDCNATAIDNGGEVSIEFTLTLNARAIVYENGTTVVATDAFSSDNKLEMTIDEVETCEVYPSSCVSDSVDGQIVLDGDRLAADTVLCVTNTACSTENCWVENGRVFCEGVVSGDIVYYNAEKNAVDSVPFSLPYSMPLNVDTEGVSVEVFGAVTNTTVKIRRESVFDIKNEVVFNVYSSSFRKVKAVSGITVGEPIDKPSSTVVVHIASEGETLWQAAKALGGSPEQVEKQNAVKPPYAKGDRLINFCKR